MTQAKKPLARLCAALLAALLAAGLFFAAPLPVRAESSTSTGDSSAADDSAAEGGEEGDEDGDEDGDAEIPPPEGSLYAPQDFTPQAAAVYLMNVDTGLAVYQYNADTPLVAASLVKMMTCILTMEYAERYGKNLDTTMVDSTNKGWIYDELYGKNASTADIRKGEVLSLRELLYAALLPSANEAALLLADYVGGGYMVNFMYQMHKRAETLGCTGTTFDDPNGLSENNLTTAHDMALITREFMRYPQLVEIAGTSIYEMAQHEQHTAPYNIFTTNRLLVETSPYYNYFPGMKGTIQAGKTGSLGEWQNFASQATKNGETYICVVMNSPNEADEIGAQMEPQQTRPALCESAKLYQWAFSELTVKSALDTTQPVKELRVKYATQQDTVLLMPLGDVKAVLKKDDTEGAIRRKYDLPDAVEAPVAEGTVMGSVTLSVSGVEIGSAELYAQKDVERNPTLYMLTRFGEMFTSTYLRVVVVLVLVAAGIYAGLLALAANSRSRAKSSAGKKQRAAAGPAPPPANGPPAPHKKKSPPKPSQRPPGGRKGTPS